MEDDGTTITLYCNNDACDVKSARYESTFPPNRCAECGAPLEKTPPRREKHTRGPRTYDTF